jgi:hypothetical protein
MPSRESKMTFGAAIAGEITPKDKAAEARETINFFENKLFIVVVKKNEFELMQDAGARCKGKGE